MNLCNHGNYTQTALMEIISCLHRYFVIGMIATGTFVYICISYPVVDQWNIFSKWSLTKERVTNQHRQISNENTEEALIDPYKNFNFTPAQIKRIKLCSKSYAGERNVQLKDAQHKYKDRWNSHTYLNSKSVVLELGGHVGNDLRELHNRYEPARYIVLEPVRHFYNILVEQFGKIPGIEVHNFGIGLKSEDVFVGKVNDGSSIYKEYKNYTDANIALKIVAVKSFFMEFDFKSGVHLLTMNCEGCEYAVLDHLLRSNIMRRFWNIQFQPHFHKKLDAPLRRYCEYQELLRRTHLLVYQHKFWWESWTSKA